MLNRTEFMSEKKAKKKGDVTEKKCTSSEEDFDTHHSNNENSSKLRRKKSISIEKSLQMTLSDVAIKPRSKTHSSKRATRKEYVSTDKKSKKNKEIETLYPGNEVTAKRSKEKRIKSGHSKSEKKIHKKHEIRDKSKSKNIYSKNLKKLLNYSNDFYDHNLKNYLTPESSLLKRDLKYSGDASHREKQSQILDKFSRKKTNPDDLDRTFSDESRKTFSDALSILSYQCAELNKNCLQNLVKNSSKKDEKNKNFVHKTKKRICPKILRTSKTKRSSEFGRKYASGKKSKTVLDSSNSDEDLNDLKLNELDELDEDDLRELYDNISTTNISKVLNEKSSRVENSDTGKSTHSSSSKDSQTADKSKSKAHRKCSSRPTKSSKTSAHESDRHRFKNKSFLNQKKKETRSDKKNNCYFDEDEAAIKKKSSEFTANSKKKSSYKKQGNGLSGCQLDSKSSIQFCHMIANQLPDAKIIPFEALSEILPKEELDKVNDKIDKNIEEKQILLPGIFEDTQSHIDRIKQQVLKKAKECLPSATFSKINQFLLSNKNGNNNASAEKLSARKEISYSVPSFQENSKSAYSRSSYHELKGKVSSVNTKKKQPRASATSHHGDGVQWKRYGRKPDMSVSNSYYTHLYSVYSDGKQRNRLRGKSGRKYASDNVLGDKHFKKMSQFKDRFDIKSEDKVNKKECDKSKTFDQKLGRKKSSDYFLKVCRNCNKESCICNNLKNTLFQLGDHNIFRCQNARAISNVTKDSLSPLNSRSKSNCIHKQLNVESRNHLNARQNMLLKSKILDKGDSNLLDLDFPKSKSYCRNGTKNCKHRKNQEVSVHSDDFQGSLVSDTNKDGLSTKLNLKNSAEHLTNKTKALDLSTRQSHLQNREMKLKRMKQKSKSENQMKNKKAFVENGCEKLSNRKHVNRAHISNDSISVKKYRGDKEPRKKCKNKMEIRRQEKSHVLAQNLKRSDALDNTNENPPQFLAKYTKGEKTEFVTNTTVHKCEKNICYRVATISNANKQSLLLSVYDQTKIQYDKKILSDSNFPESIFRSNGQLLFHLLEEGIRGASLRHQRFNENSGLRKAVLLNVNKELSSDFFRPETVNFCKNLYKHFDTQGKVQMYGFDFLNVGNNNFVKNDQLFRDSRCMKEASFSVVSLASGLSNLQRKLTEENRLCNIRLNQVFEIPSQVQNETSIMQPDTSLKSLIHHSILVNVPEVTPVPQTLISHILNHPNAIEVTSTNQRTQSSNELSKLNSTKQDSDLNSDQFVPESQHENCSIKHIPTNFFKVCNTQKYKLVSDIKFVNSNQKIKSNRVSIVNFVNKPFIQKCPRFSENNELLKNKSFSVLNFFTPRNKSTSCHHFYDSQIQHFGSRHCFYASKYFLNARSPFDPFDTDSLSYFLLSFLTYWHDKYCSQLNLKENNFLESTPEKSRESSKTTSSSVQTDLSLISSEAFDSFLKTCAFRNHCVSVTLSQQHA